MVVTLTNEKKNKPVGTDILKGPSDSPEPTLLTKDQAEEIFKEEDELYPDEEKGVKLSDRTIVFTLLNELRQVMKDFYGKNPKRIYDKIDELELALKKIL